MMMRRDSVGVFARMKLRGELFSALLSVLLAGCLLASGCADGADDTDDAKAGNPSSESVPTSGGAELPDEASKGGSEGDGQNATPGTSQMDDDVAAGAGVPASFDVSFDYKRQSGHASNQFAVWIEDGDGGYVTTLYATDFTADGGWEIRPTSIPDWVKAVGLPEGQDVDAVTSATPSAGKLKYTWDLTDAHGEVYRSDTFTVVVEGTLRWNNQVVYRCAVERNTGRIVSESAEFLLRDSDDGKALAEDAPETSMLTNFGVAPRYDQAGA
jgi:hypothetical protein